MNLIHLGMRDYTFEAPQTLINKPSLFFFKLKKKNLGFEEFDYVRC